MNMLNLKSLISRLIKVVIPIIICLFSIEKSSISVFAQTLNPSVWQNTATGLKTNPKTGGLGFVVENQGWPTLSLRGGIKYNGLDIEGPIGIQLGQIKIPNTIASLTNETVDWAHNEMTFSYGGTSPLKLWASRITPAILVQGEAAAIRFLTGTLYPKYLAYSNGGTVRVQTLSTNDFSLPTLDRNWILIWYGGNSSINDTKIPLLCSGDGFPWDHDCRVPSSEGYQADTPILLVFQNKPGTIKHSPEGGVEISSFSGYASILPLFGRNTLRASQTETWSSGLPGDVITKAQFWAAHLCDFPVTVSESYAYNAGTDTVTISENMSFINVCSGGTKLAPLPPFLGIAKDALGVSFSGTVIDAKLPTEYGPSLGIENTESYTWSVSGLKKYTDSKRVLSNGSVPQELQQELENQVSKITTSGHYAPWIFMDSVPLGYFDKGDIYWANPAETIYQLAEIISALPDGNTRTNLLNYLKSERTNYEPEDQYRLTYNEGTIRGDYGKLFFSLDFHWGYNSARPDINKEHFYQRVPLFNFSSLARYYDLTEEGLASAVYQKAITVLDTDMKEQDWATGYWFKGFGDFNSHPQAVTSANKHFAGLVGFIKLAVKANDTQAEALGRALFAKASVGRIAMSKYPRYLYSAGLVELPARPDWQVRYIDLSTGQVPMYAYLPGFLYNYDWTEPFDDARQVYTLDQFELSLRTEVITPYARGYLLSYEGLTPELGRFLANHAKQDAEVYIKKSEALWPHWYAAFAEGTLGAEHNLNYPEDSFQIFSAKAYIQKESADNLYKYSDISWLSQGGDLFYIHKLAETVKAYKGWSWSDQPLPTQGPTATPTPSCPLGSQGDVNCDRKIDILDLVSILSNFGRVGTGVAGDVNGDSKVDILDLVTLLGNFGKVS